MTGRDWHLFAFGFEFAVLSGAWGLVVYALANCLGQGCLIAILFIYAAFAVTAVPIVHALCWFAWTRWRRRRRSVTPSDDR